MIMLLIPFFILISQSLYTQVMLILILINVQYLQNVVFNFEKGSNGQTHSSATSHHPIKKFPLQNSLVTIWKTPMWATKHLVETHQNSEILDNKLDLYLYESKDEEEKII